MSRASLAGLVQNLHLYINQQSQLNLFYHLLWVVMVVVMVVVLLPSVTTA